MTDLGIVVYFVFYVGLISVLVAIGFAPAIIAFRREHPHRWLIFFVNLLFGATVIGWIVALLWALNSLPFTEDFHGRLGTLTVAREPRFNTASPQPPTEEKSDPADQLRRLKQLYESDVLTEEEYRRLREPLLSRLL